MFAPQTLFAVILIAITVVVSATVFTVEVFYYLLK